MVSYDCAYFDRNPATCPTADPNRFVRAYGTAGTVQSTWRCILGLGVSGPQVVREIPSPRALNPPGG